MIRKKIIFTSVIGILTHFDIQKAMDNSIQTYQQQHFDEIRKPIILWNIHHVAWEFEQKREIQLRNNLWLLLGLSEREYRNSKESTMACAPKT